MGEQMLENLREARKFAARTEELERESIVHVVVKRLAFS